MNKVYRDLLQSARVAFKNDIITFCAFRSKVRDEFLKERSEDEIGKCLEEAKIVSQILRHNIIQGEMEDGSNTFKMKVEERHQMGENDARFIKSEKASCKCCECIEK
jgi:hypothetical protein